MNEIGVVTSVENGIARVEIRRGALCAHCGCCVRTGPDTMELEARDDIGVAPGDEVSLDFPDYMFVKVAFTAYGAPAVAFFAALVVCLAVLKMNEWQSALAAVAATAAAYVVISRTGFARRGSEDMRPSIAGKASAAADGGDE